MDNTKVLNALDEFAKTKPKDIPKELDDYIRYVAGSGDHVYQWSLVKCLFRQKLVNVISEFYESCPMMDVPLSPNVDAFNYELLKSRLLQRYDKFSGAPFTIQRLAELLTAPKKQYNRVDKFMRAIEKNIWVVSTREPGRRESVSQETSLVNGVLSPVILSNNVKSNQERLIRQSELFDDDEEDEEDNDDDHGESAAEVPLTESETVLESTSHTAAETSLETSESTSTTESEHQTYDSKPVVSDNVAATNSESSQEEIEDPASNENSSASASCSDDNEEAKTDSEDRQGDADVETAKEETQVVVTEVSEPESATGEENISEINVEEPQEEKDVSESENKEDLKRKFVDDDEEEVVSCKKLETEDLAPSSVSHTALEESVEEAAQEELETEKKDEVIGIAEIPEGECESTEREAASEGASELERIEVIEESTEKEQEDQEVTQEQVQAAAEIADDEGETSLEIAEVEDMAEKDMESADVDDKTEMLVEDPPEQAMEVDETNSQSPMEDCAAGEPMEADIGQS